ncbi:MAG: pyridoxine 5'-phosphate synthase [Alphaproteobacteria bacterium]|nr:pyridoxine 5'-phosphate synthase [Alphaproteobacteria bacterium]
MTERLRLGINIDHVATLRNARGGRHPDPLRAAAIAAKAGADSITAHLREDRRHIQDADIVALAREGVLPLNLEMAATPEMLEVTLANRPHAVCLVPEKRQELTTEGGLDAVAEKHHLAPYVEAMMAIGIEVAIFIDPERAQVEAARALGAFAVELHTGRYCNAEGEARTEELHRLVEAAERAVGLGLECHAGHGLSFDTVAPVAAIPEVCELNIGHFLVGEGVFVGLGASVQTMRALMDDARNGPLQKTTQRGSA